MSEAVANGKCYLDPKSPNNEVSGIHEDGIHPDAGKEKKQQARLQIVPNQSRMSRKLNLSLNAQNIRREMMEVV